MVVWGVYALRDVGSSETGPIKIGFIGPMSGDAGNLGENARAAVQIAVKEVNEA